MYLVDTCGWIEWLSNGKLQSSFEKYLTITEKLIVPTIIQYELFKWICREKNEVTAFDVLGVTELAKIVSLDISTAILAAKLSVQYKLAMADALILATAQKNQAQLITCDSHFDTLPGVIYLKK